MSEVPPPPPHVPLPQATPPHGPAPHGPPAQLPPPPLGPAYDLPAPEVVQDEEWHRLDPKMLMVTPVRTLGQALFPILIAVFGISRGNDDNGMPLYMFAVFAGLAMVFGLLPWFTTQYRFTDTQLQVKRGLLNKKLVTAPLDRVRSVDLESSLLHRLLGLAKVKVGTGVDETRIELDSLNKGAAAELRQYLLRRSGVARSSAGAVRAPDAGAIGAPGGGPVLGPQPAAGGTPAEVPLGQQLPAEQELARIDWGWLRFAPFSLGSLVVAAGALGFFMQFNDDLHLVEPERVEDAYEWAVGQTILLLVAGLLVIGLIGWIALSTLNYVVQWWNLRLVREGDGDGTLRLTRGLFTTRSTTVEEARVRGVALTEPVLLSMVHGAELSTLATGVGTGGKTKVLPPCPREVAVRVGHTVLQEAGPLVMPLRRHGPAAHRRLHVQAQLDLPFLVAALVAVVLWRDWPRWWIAAGAVVLALLGAAWAELAYRNLGHGLTPKHLVSRVGAVQRQRTALERAGIIGWVVEQSFFQRRRGLATLVATTAAGGEQVKVENLPLEWAVGLADEATPGLLTQFLA